MWRVHEIQACSTEEPQEPHEVPSLPWFRHIWASFSPLPAGCRLLQQVPCCKETDQSVSGTCDKSCPDNICKIWGTSNGVRRFVFQEFKQYFALQYRFEVQHSSPRYPQSNGFIEAMVKVVKAIKGEGRRVGFWSTSCNVTWHQALFSFRFENYIPAGMAKRKESLIQIFYETSAAHFFDWLTFAESANQNYFRCLFF